jgi:glutathione S-transferase
MQLYIGNKNYSSWSLRPWVLMKQLGIAFEEVMVRFDSFDADSRFKREVLRVNPTGKVPVLVDGDVVVWDTLAIAEYLAEKFPALALWPADRAQRARARSVSAEMHSGFGALRNHFPMNIEASLPEVGPRILEQEPAVRADLARIEQMWTALLTQHGGPFLFGARFTIPDAFFAPVCTRLRTYRPPLSPQAAAYVETIHGLPGMQAWVTAALAEKDFIPFDEPYRTQPATA